MEHGSLKFFFLGWHRSCLLYLLSKRTADAAKGGGGSTAHSGGGACKGPWTLSKQGLSYDGKLHSRGTEQAAAMFDSTGTD